ncbi:hypothetical protein IG631_16099 [Alternaria alternata]|nr:hypothetical protein IG631_16099 [Alternaria alternata]
MPVIMAVTASGSSSVMLLGVMRSHTDCEDAAVWLCDLKQLLGGEAGQPSALCHQVCHGYSATVDASRTATPDVLTNEKSRCGVLSSRPSLRSELLASGGFGVLCLRTL